MSVPRFADTNVLVYAVDASEPSKRARALEVLSFSGQPPIIISSQVLGEFFNTVTRKLGMPVEIAAAEVRRLAPRAKVGVDRELVADAIELCATRSLSYWDALIVAAAIRAGCSELLTEDLNAGEVISGVEIVNPFAELSR